MKTYTRSSFKGGSVGVLAPRANSEKVSGILPLMYDSKKTNFDLGLRNDKLKQATKQFETKRKL
jgi:hypothetical protein